MYILDVCIAHQHLCRFYRLYIDSIAHEHLEVLRAGAAAAAEAAATKNNMNNSNTINTNHINNTTNNDINNNRGC